MQLLSTIGGKDRKAVSRAYAVHARCGIRRSREGKCRYVYEGRGLRPIPPHISYETLRAVKRDIDVEMQLIRDKDRYIQSLYSEIEGIFHTISEIRSGVHTTGIPPVT